MAFFTIMMFLAAASAQGIKDEIMQHERRLESVKISEKIVIDGKLEEESWGKAPVATGFIQNEPQPGEPASEQTEVRVLYDNENIYFGFVMKESRMDEIVINELDKDFSRRYTDTIEVILDTFHDKRNGYLFSTNAAGAKYDAQMINEGRPRTRTGMASGMSRPRAPGTTGSPRWPYP